MKKIIAVALFIFCANILVAQPAKSKTKKSNNFSWGASNPTGIKTSEKQVSVREGGANDATFKKPKANNKGAKTKPTNSFQEVSGIGMEVKSEKAVKSPRDAASGKTKVKRRN